MFSLLITGSYFQKCNSISNQIALQNVYTYFVTENPGLKCYDFRMNALLRYYYLQIFAKTIQSYGFCFEFESKLRALKHNTLQRYRAGK